MVLIFSKYHGAGNDFILVDNRENTYDLSVKQIADLCHRNMGIGANGLILIAKSNQADFKMNYFNSDGLKGSLCGNGGRCAVAFSKNLKLFNENCFFEAFDGLHRAWVDPFGLVKMEMKELSIITKKDAFWKLDTGSPHLVTFSDDIDELNVKTEGAKIRNSPAYISQGINVNFAHIQGNEIYIRTYERGVEEETLACGTGAVASAIASFESNLISVTEINVHTLGGLLKVEFEKINKIYCNIILTGEARFVYEGKIKI